MTILLCYIQKEILKMYQKNNPLVSIIIITYNSSKYILETLESARNQTYHNIELIISDDCSIDDTIEICQKWLKENESRFTRTELITVNKNTGTSSNANRGLYSSKGKWIKFIAGDDILMNNCIQTFVDETNKNSQIKLLFSNVSFDGKISEEGQTIEPFFTLSVKEQYINLLKGNFLLAPTLFINRTTAITLNGFNEKYSLFEDFPFYLKALKNNIKLSKVKQQLIYYRIHGSNVSLGANVNLRYQKDIKLFFKEEYLKELWKNKLHIYLIHYCTEYILINLALLKVIKNVRTYQSLLNWLSILNWEKRLKNYLKNGK